ncbi:MAG: hypothetical protein HY850_09320 [Betaproteobacteria bacterium]|nr:hypothetical protein [Betaproteobacteria bacterium]
MKQNCFLAFVTGLALFMGVAGQAGADAVYASYTGSQQGVTIRDVNTLNQYVWFNTGINASGINVDSGNNIYLPAGNQIRKYSLSGSLLVKMTFPISSINYTDVAVSGNKVYASYTGSQQGVTIRDANTLNQLSYFNTGINASGIAVDSSNNIYLSAGNRLRKYNSGGTLLVEMVFPDAGINYTGIAVSGDKVYASYTGSQQGVTTRDANTLNQFSYFDTGINASGIALDSSNNIYLSAGNRLRKYNGTGSLLAEMVFPDARINYSGITVK